MSRKKKPRKQTETQKQQQLLQKIHVEIPVDYELLAKEILKQQDLLEQAKQKVQDDNKEVHQKKRNIFQIIWLVLRNKEDTKGKFLSGSMSTLLSGFFRLMGMGLFFIAILSVIATVKYIIQSSWITVNQFFSNLYVCLIFVFIFIMAILIGTIMIGSANEIEREKDRSYIADVFSGIFGFVGLIVALIALYKQINP